MSEIFIACLWALILGLAVNRARYMSKHTNAFDFVSLVMIAGGALTSLLPYVRYLIGAAIAMNDPTSTFAYAKYDDWGQSVFLVGVAGWLGMNNLRLWLHKSGAPDWLFVWVGRAPLHMFRTQKPIGN